MAFSCKFYFSLFFHETSKRILFLLGCIFSGIPSYGNTDMLWQDFNPPQAEADPPQAEAFWDAIKPKKNSDSFNAHRQEVESMVDRIVSNRAFVSYHICDIFKSSSDKSVPFTLSPGTVAYLPGNITPCAVKIFGKTSAGQQNPWEHPFDTSNLSSPNQSPCALLPNGFLIRHYDKTSSGKNESFNLSNLKDGHGFTFLVFIPDTLLALDNPDAERIPWCSIVRARIWVTVTPQDRFVKMLDPQLKIKNVSGDGNC
ncbi:MAG: hypothetical protein LBD40_03435, partial [Puniceicoccales bacterium]|nr:hypothetical protein [Puniceicoccales bacterium]